MDEPNIDKGVAIATLAQLFGVKPELFRGIIYLDGAKGTVFGQEVLLQGAMAKHTEGTGWARYSLMNVSVAPATDGAEVVHGREYGLKFGTVVVIKGEAPRPATWEYIK